MELLLLLSVVLRKDLLLLGSVAAAAASSVDRQTKIYSVADGTARSGTTKHTTTKHDWSADRLQIMQDCPRYAMQNTNNALHCR